MMNKITVLLAEDHAIVLEGLRMLLSLEDDMKVISEAKTGREAVRMTQKLHPAVVVMDIAMPVLNGLEATRQILKAVPATKVLVSRLTVMMRMSTNLSRWAHQDISTNNPRCRFWPRPFGKSAKERCFSVLPYRSAFMTAAGHRSMEKDRLKSKTSF